jgi:hypothetical protein
MFKRVAQMRCVKLDRQRPVSGSGLPHRRGNNG